MTGNRTLDRIIIIINLVITFSAVGIVIYSHLFIEAPAISQEVELEQLKAQALDDATVTPVEFDRVVLNLTNSGSRLRFLEIQINIEPFSEDQKSFLSEREYIVYDAIINIASRMPPDDLNSITGRILLEGRMKKYLNDSFKEQIVKKIYFSKFVVQ